MPSRCMLLLLGLAACGRPASAPAPGYPLAPGIEADEYEVSSFETQGGALGGEGAAPAYGPRPSRRMAQAAAAAEEEPSPLPAQATLPDEEGRVASDGVDASTPVIIYTATLIVAVFEVQESIERVRAVAEQHGGFISEQTDQTIQLRVPAAHFDAALTGLEAIGDVLSRALKAQDVSEEFHDLAVRIRTTERLLARLERLLERAENVEHALRVEQEIRRLTRELEGMKGRLRFLADRASLSTITVRFQPMQREDIEQSDLFQLPFPWLDELGLDTLLDVR